MLKRISSLMITMLLLLLCALIPVSAEAEEEPQWLYEDVFYNKYYKPYYAYSYKELHVQYLEDGITPDWVLVEAYSQTGGSSEKSAHLLGKTFLYTEDSGCKPFRYKYGVYDVECNSFHSLESVWNMDYEGLEEVVDKLGIGRLYGDIDADGAITVLDATKMQRCVAGVDKYRADSARYYKYKSQGLMYLYTDFDRDGRRTILDATAIQREVSKIPKEPKPLWYDGLATSINHRDKYYPENCDIEYTTILEGANIYLGLEDYITSYNVLIRNTEDFYRVFKCYDERFNDEYFESKALVASINRAYIEKSFVNIERISVKDDCLYMHTTRGYISESEFEIVEYDHIYHTICEVDADAVKDVKIIRRGWSR